MHMRAAFSSTKLSKSSFSTKLTEGHLQATLRVPTSQDVTPIIGVLLIMNAACLVDRKGINKLIFVKIHMLFADL